MEAKQEDIEGSSFRFQQKPEKHREHTPLSYYQHLPIPLSQANLLCLLMHIQYIYRLLLFRNLTNQIIISN